MSPRPLGFFAQLGLHLGLLGMVWPVQSAWRAFAWPADGGAAPFKPLHALFLAAALASLALDVAGLLGLKPLPDPMSGEAAYLLLATVTALDWGRVFGARGLTRQPGTTFLLLGHFAVDWTACRANGVSPWLGGPFKYPRAQATALLLLGLAAFAGWSALEAYDPAVTRAFQPSSRPRG